MNTRAAASSFLNYIITNLHLFNYGMILYLFNILFYIVVPFSIVNLYSIYIWNVYRHVEQFRAEYGRYQLDAGIIYQL